MEHPIIIDSRGKIAKKISGIAGYIASAAGRAKLAASMIAPLRRSMNYTAIARQAISIQPLPPGAMPTYSKDIDVPSIVLRKTKGFRHSKIVISSRGKVGKYSNGMFGTRVTVPQFQIYSNPTIKISEVKRRRFNLIDRYTEKRGYKHNKVFISSRGKVQTGTQRYQVMSRAVQKARMEIMAQEDTNIFAALDAAVKAGTGNKTE